MDELTQLAIKYGTDKWGKHHYTPVYYDLFKDKRESVKKVLEIGPAEGAGLFMFRDFFPNATIYGAEIDQKRVDKLQGLDRIEVFQCDQSTYQLFDIEETSSGGYNLNLVIDDGSHKPDDQIFSCQMLMSKMPKDSIYIIEDVADPAIVDQLKNYNCEVLKVGKRYDDRLVIIRHKQ